MGATKNNIVIGILVVIIACLSVSLYRVTRLRRVLYEVSNRVPKQIPLDVFVTGMTEAVERQEQIRNDIISQNRWLLRHLERTLAILEAEYKLEPIPVKTYSFSEPINSSVSIVDPDIFVTPYQKNEYQSPVMDPNECGLLHLESRIIGNSQSIILATDSIHFWIENFYERLQRLEQTLEAAKKENPK